ncbi:hypothetical protein VP01_3981g1 [Puccinia sorghi]|uniref:Uncharacterized protein n=1 Tax=Puccinia sorghi TaxID=27349 RepID=A0A0L6UT36_9BASI|nr:hypothetical protein VP01_3981g1 [Puccinia sorghi]
MVWHLRFEVLVVFEVLVGYDLHFSLIESIQSHWGGVQLLQSVGQKGFLMGTQIWGSCRPAQASGGILKPPKQWKLVGFYWRSLIQNLACGELSIWEISFLEHPGTSVFISGTCLCLDESFDQPDLRCFSCIQRMLTSKNPKSKISFVLTFDYFLPGFYGFSHLFIYLQDLNSGNMCTQLLLIVSLFSSVSGPHGIYFVFMFILVSWLLQIFINQKFLFPCTLKPLLISTSFIISIHFRFGIVWINIRILLPQLSVSTQFSYIPVPITAKNKLAQLPAVEMQKLPGSFCCYSNLSPRQYALIIYHIIGNDLPPRHSPKLKFPLSRRSDGRPETAYCSRATKAELASTSLTSTSGYSRLMFWFIAVLFLVVELQLQSLSFLSFRDIDLILFVISVHCGL